MAPSKHARFSPSASSRWLSCPASVRLTDEAIGLGLVKEETNPSAELGTHAHHLAETALLSGKSLREVAGRFFDPTYQPLQAYIDFCSDLMAQADHFAVEARLEILPPHCYGTADFVAYIKPRRELVVCDLKFGLGRVNPRHNTQLRLYALGAYRNWVKDEVDWIRTVVVQPRLTLDPQEDAFLPAELELLEANAKRAIQLADNPQTKPRPGEHCRWCLASGTTCFEG